MNQARIPAWILSISLAVVAGCSDSSTPAPTTSPTTAPATTASTVPAAQQASAAKSMGLTFPAETRFAFYQRASEQSRMPGPDDAVNLKIELPAASLATFLAQPPLSTAKWSSDHSSMPNLPTSTDWQPSKAHKFRYQQFQLPKGQGLNVLIDDDNAETKVIYLFWFET